MPVNRPRRIRLAALRLLYCGGPSSKPFEERQRANRMRRSPNVSSEPVGEAPRPDEALEQLLRRLTDPHGKWYPPAPPPLPDLERVDAEEPAAPEPAQQRAGDEWEPA